MTNMPTWTFFDGLKKTQIEQVDPRWASALEAALQSKATPLQSNYHVNTGAVTRNGNVVSGSNHEMAITDTITHGEEAVIAAALEKFGQHDPIQVIAFAGLGGAEIASPCGNCRDAIKEYTDLDNLVIINAPRDGGVAVLVPGNAYFKDTFGEMKRLDKGYFPHGIAEALHAEKIAYDIYSGHQSPKVYGAAIVCEVKKKHLIFRGSFRGDVAYHPELPISAAISNFRDGSDDPKRRNVKEIVVAATGHVPNVMYKDRQHALEFAEAMQSLNGRSGEPLPVYLVIDSGVGDIPKILKTDTHEWLPLAFSPKHLGLEKSLASGYDKLFRE